MLSRNEKPFVLHLDSVLSSVECDELISLSRSRLQPSRVVDTVRELTGQVPAEQAGAWLSASGKMSWSKGSKRG
ncbi:hypothetical protein [Cytobacillus firmus]|uniref:hypothetical protein n=1 Tax=Cytobacillus firmus TaxID=1399 RepID=UPI000B006470|nr:hypothetical protein [Cytobacillus firmus]